MTDWSSYLYDPREVVSDAGWSGVADARENGFHDPRPASRPDGGDGKVPTHVVIHLTAGATYEPARDRFTRLPGPNASPASAHYVIKRDGEVVQFVKDEHRAWHAGVNAPCAHLYEQGEAVWQQYLCSDEQAVPREAHDVVQVTAKESWSPFREVTRPFARRREGARWGVLADLARRHRERTGGDLPAPAGRRLRPNDHSIGFELVCRSIDAGGDTARFTDAQYDALARVLEDLSARHGIPLEPAFILGHEDVHPLARCGWDPGLAFDWDRVLAGRRAPRTTFPVALPSGAPPAAYAANERGVGGFFPLGLRSNLHPGIHLRPPAGAGALAPVVASMPGWVVAARLAPQHPESARLLAGHRGFVLLRHELRPAAGGEPLALYTLSMHLAPPRWDAPADPYRQVPWLARLERARHGALVVVDPSAAAAPAALRYPVAPAPDPLQGAVAARDDQGARVDVALGAAAAARPVALLRPGPDDAREALAALREGAVATFDRPWLCVRKGEPLGLVEAAAAPSGALHWELFAPAGRGVDALLDLAERELGLGAGFFPRVEDRHDDNHLDPEELDALLAANLPAADRAALGGPLLPDEPHEARVLGLLHAPAPLSFARGAGGDAPPGAHPGLEGDHAACGRALTWPFRLELEPWTGAATGPPPRLVVRFEPAGLPGDGATVTPRAEGGLWVAEVQVPAVATALLVEPPPDALLDRPRPPRDAGAAEVAALRALLPHRWRHLRVRHVTEWLPGSMRRAIERRLGDAAPHEAAWRPATFWARGPRTDADPDGEVPVVGAAGSERSPWAPGGLLPADGRVDALHPVTGLWLIEALVARRALALVDAWPAVDHGEPDERLAWGWVAAGDRVAVGQEVVAVVVSRGWGGGEVALAATSGARRLDLGAHPAPQGVVAARLPARFWGEWTLAPAGAAAAPPGLPRHGALPTTLRVAAPALVRAEPPVRAGGAFTLAVVVRGDVEVLEGWLLLRAWRVAPRAAPDGPGSLCGAALPVDLRRVAAARGLAAGEVRLEGRVSPGPALAALLEELPPAAGQELAVTLGVLCPNGGRAAALDRPAEDAPERAGGAAAPTRLDPEAARARAGEDRLEAWPAAPSLRLGWPRFGPLEASVEGGELVLRAALLGASDADWVAAAPRVKVEPGGALLGGRIGGALAARVALDDARVRGARRTFSAVVTKADATFGGALVPVAPARLELDTTPRLESLQATWEGELLRVRGQARAFPTGKNLRLVVERPASGGWVDAGLGREASFLAPADVPGEGRVDGAGRLEAALSRALLVAALGPGTRLRLRLLRPSGGEYGPVAGVPGTAIAPVEAETAVPAPATAPAGGGA